MSTPAQIIDATSEVSPFSISPNPLAMHVTDSLRAILVKCRFTITKGQGVAVLLGELGTGKSTVLRYLHAEFSSRSEYQTSLIPTPKFNSSFAFLRYLAEDLGVPTKRSLTAQADAIQDYLREGYAQGKNTVVFVDEAQILSNDQLETLRGLLNFETNSRKLVQFIVAGQLELREKLRQERNKPLHSRVSTYSILNPLTHAEVAELLRHRCDYEQIPFPFTSAAIEKLYTLTGGIPRAVLKCAALAYEMMQMEQINSIDDELINDAAPEVGVDG
jgi:general secretion pathway protein A